MRRTIISLAAVLILAAMAPPAMAATTTTTEITTIPFTTTIGDNPCTGEPVTLQGELRVITHVTESAGSYIANSFLLPRRVTGVGVSTGAEYVFVGATHSSFTLTGALQNEVTDTFSSSLVSRGGGGNLLVTGVFHETVNANGEVTALVDSVGATCTG
jgi:hypothetical protein